jgi:hypothetical protein
MNENNNRVARVISAAEFMTVTDLLTKIESILLPYTVGLTPNERMGIPKINVDNKVFIEDCFNEMKVPSSANFMPAFLKTEDMEVDLTMFDLFETLTTRLASLTGKVDNTRMLAGSEAFSTALVFKKMADAAEAAGIPGADITARKLRERFKGQGSSAKPDEEQDNPDEDVKPS